MGDDRISGGYRCPLCDDDAASRPPILAATRQLTNLMPKMLRYSDDDAPARGYPPGIGPSPTSSAIWCSGTKAFRWWTPPARERNWSAMT